MTEMNRETIYRLLRELRNVAYQASLTGSLKKGGPMMADVYNRCLATISQADPTVNDLFPALGPEVTIDEIGVAAALLSSFVKPGEARRRHHDDDDDDEEDEE